MYIKNRKFIPMIIIAAALFIALFHYINGKEYMAFGDNCNLVDYYCGEDKVGFIDLFGCGCKNK